MEEFKSLTIDIYENSEGDWNYDIYNCSEDKEAGIDSLDGGCCTSTIENALEMATDQAKQLLKRIETNKQKEKKENSIIQKKLNIVEEILKDINLIVSCDEEWNTLYGKFEIGIDKETKRPVIFGLSGSEIKQ